MDPFLVGGIALGVWVVAGLWAAAKDIYPREMLRGMQDAIEEITVGVASNCERQAIPEQVADQLEGHKESNRESERFAGQSLCREYTAVRTGKCTWHGRLAGGMRSRPAGRKSPERARFGST
jgi:hypothetical protein